MNGSRRKFLSASLGVVTARPGLGMIVAPEKLAATGNRASGAPENEPLAPSEINAPDVVHDFRVLREPVLMSDTRLLAVAIRYRGGHQVLTGQTSSDDGRTWRAPLDLMTLPREAGMFGYYKAFADDHGEIQIFFLCNSEIGVSPRGGLKPKRRKILDIWHTKTRNRGSVWEPARRIWQGRAGDLLSVIQLKTGRILLPICYLTDRSWRNRGAGFDQFTYVGSFEASALYSDDRGETWRQSPARLNVQTPDLSSLGAIEPVVLQLRDGRVWMLIRTQVGRFYEAFSSDGVTWTQPRPTGIVSSDSPAGLLRLKDGRIFMLVNDCQRFPYAHGGRQVLLGAVSSDEGKTWRGYREVIRDPLRGEPPPQHGDFGVAYPFAALTADGKVLFTMGVQSGTRSQAPEGPQGVAPTDKRAMVLVDPAWLDQTSQQTDFSQGLDDWSIFGTRGVDLVSDPIKPGGCALRIAKTSTEWPAGAVWNFPAGRKGRLHLRMALRRGFGGCLVGLTDEFSPPWDSQDFYHNAFNLPVGPDGIFADAMRIGAGRWRELELNWDCDQRMCHVAVDGRGISRIALNRTPQSHGICYLRLRSIAQRTDAAGALIRSISVQVMR